jgi:hypothetical protein
MGVRLREECKIKAFKNMVLRIYGRGCDMRIQIIVYEEIRNLYSRSVITQAGLPKKMVL